MPTFKYKVPLEGQPDQIVGCEMFERSVAEKISGYKGGLYTRLIEDGVYKDYCVPLVDTSDVRASEFRIKKANGVFALSKGDYVPGTAWTHIDSFSENGEKTRTYSLNPAYRYPADASGSNIHLHVWQGGGGWVTSRGRLYVNGKKIWDYSDVWAGSRTRDFYVYSPTSTFTVRVEHGVFGALEIDVEVRT